MPEKSISALLAMACTAGLLACIPAAAPDLSDTSDPVATREPAGSQAQAVASSDAIIGQWDIVSFDGYRPARLEGTKRAAFADFGPDGVGLRIECNYSGAVGRVVDGRFVAGPDDNAQTAMGCGPEREARDAALFGFFDRNPSVTQLPDGSLRLVAGDTVLELQRPAQHRLAYLPSAKDLLGEWRLVELTRYHPGGGFSGIGLSDVPGRITFDGITAGYTRCPQFDFAYRLSKDGRLLLEGSKPVARVGCAALVEPARGPRMPTLEDLVVVLHSNPMTELVDKDTLLLSTEEMGLLVTKAPCVSFEQTNDHTVTREVDCASPR